MKFISCNAGIAGFVEVTYETVHQVKKNIFIWVVVFPVEPVNDITSYQFIVYYHCIISCACRAELIFRI